MYVHTSKTLEIDFIFYVYIYRLLLPGHIQNGNIIYPIYVWGILKSKSDLKASSSGDMSGQGKYPEFNDDDIIYPVSLI